MNISWIGHFLTVFFPIDIPTFSMLDLTKCYTEGVWIPNRVAQNQANPFGKPTPSMNDFSLFLSHGVRISNEVH